MLGWGGQWAEAGDTVIWGAPSKNRGSSEAEEPQSLPNHWMGTENPASALKEIALRNIGDGVCVQL